MVSKHSSCSITNNTRWSSSVIAVTELHHLQWRLAERERALMEIQRRWRAGEQLPHAGKIAQSMKQLTHLIITPDHHPKRGRKHRRKRKKRKQTRVPPSSQSATAGTPNTSIQTSIPPGGNVNGHPGPSAVMLDPPPPPPPPEENLIDLEAPQPTPGQSVEGLMATLNIN